MLISYLYFIFWFVKNICQLISHDKKYQLLCFPGGSVFNLLDTANANPDTGLSPDPARFYMPWDT